ncbi:MAG TPA: FtsX-like permease family protein [Micromonosporaceae bacterium]|jgi:putative ABC transport system permease protein
MVASNRSGQPTRPRARWRPFGVLTTGPWWRGPFLLLSRAGVAVALLAAGAIATVPAASALPFLSSSRSAALHHQLAASCQWSVGATVESTLGTPKGNAEDPYNPDYAAAVERRTEATSLAAASVPLLGPAETTLITPVVYGNSEIPGQTTYPMYLVYRQDSPEHLQVVDGTGGAGVWVPDVYAEFAGITVGDEMTIARIKGGEPTVTLPVVAIYRSLRDQPDQPWWCDLRGVYDLPAGNNPAPETLFIDEPAFLSLPSEFLGPSFGGVGSGTARHRIAFPLTDLGLDIDQARRMVDGFNAARPALAEPTDDDIYGQDNGVFVSSSMPSITGRADLVRASLLHPVAPIAATGALVGLVVVGAAAAYWVRRRQRELTMLAARGVGAGALAVKGVLEAAPALLVGTIAGWAGAWFLVSRAGPDPVISAEAAPGAAIAAAVTLALEIAVVLVVSGLTSRGLADQVRARRHIRVLRLLPYEVLLLVAAPLAWGWLGDERKSVGTDPALGVVVHVPGRLLVVPILVVGGLTILVARFTVLVLRSRRATSTSSGAARFLAGRRITRQAVLVALLASATSMPVALASFGSTVTDSVRTTIADEARLYAGTDVVLTLRSPAEIPPSLAGRATSVVRWGSARLGGVVTDLLGVDPDTFERVAYWNTSLGGESMHDLLAPLRAGSQSQIPTIVASGKVPAGVQKANWGSRDVLGGTVRVVNTPALPAQYGGYPVALVPLSGTTDLASYGQAQLWVRGERSEVLAAAAAANLPVTRVLAAADLYANTLWEPLTYTFDYLTALSLLTGVVTLVGLLLYLESQAPQRRRAFVLLRRMGMSPGSHRRALLGELALPLLGGLVGGIAVAAGLTAALQSTFDINPDTLPDTVIAVPYNVLGAICTMTVVVGLAAVIYAQSRIGRANPSEVLRDTI